MTRNDRTNGCTAGNAVLIFDWDDTICPSSFVDQWNIDNFKELPLQYQNMFNEVGKAAEKCLETASKYGEVIIITNSDDGWVKFSAERFVPNLVSVIGKYRIVSARTRYERFYPGQPLCWKAAAFAHEVNEIYECEEEVAFGKRSRSRDMGDSIGSMESTDVSENSSVSSAESSKRREIISFGDSMEERTAVRIVSGQLAALPKSVMFISSPSPIEIIGQLNMVTAHMKFVCEHSASLDLEISPHQAQQCAETYMERNKIVTPDFEFSAPPIRVGGRDEAE
eukprot:CAMPEP_0194033682 /NCGR_PEP_ID=MMETSP0009_2-20130614/6270_1 /TAXON_ID=210454 /ORGANISM="Grammatophora oceanica, Strain CCMP 410" /LENGTH=280 /DNA_ID=CAMNT_0038674399 /DNA_START=122 /DNA_END=964 /DNA_ORIENTATION=+